MPRNHRTREPPTHPPPSLPAPVRREPALGDRIVPGVGGATRISLDVAADGTALVYTAVPSGTMMIFR